MPIINGVEVEGCIYYQPDKIADCGMFKIGDFKCDGQICLYKQLKQVQAENEKLKKTLQEIKEIAEHYYDECDIYRCDIAQDILQKISEVENEQLRKN